jgi:hypothetical protein
VFCAAFALSGKQTIVPELSLLALGFDEIGLTESRVLCRGRRLKAHQRNRPQHDKQHRNRSAAADDLPSASKNSGRHQQANNEFAAGRLLDEVQGSHRPLSDQRRSHSTKMEVNAFVEP